MHKAPANQLQNNPAQLITLTIPHLPPPQTNLDNASQAPQDIHLKDYRQSFC
jgi:hypothetical protein